MTFYKCITVIEVYNMQIIVMIEKIPEYFISANFINLFVIKTLKKTNCLSNIIALEN